MEKPLTIKIQEIEQKLIDIINDSEMPPYIMLNILSGLYNKIQSADNQMVEQYLREQNMKKVKKGSDR